MFNHVQDPIVQTNKTPEIELFTWSTEMSTLNSIRDLDTLLMLLVGVAGALTFLSICICFICYYRRKQRSKYKEFILIEHRFAISNNIFVLLSKLGHHVDDYRSIWNYEVVKDPDSALKAKHHLSFIYI